LSDKGQQLIDYTNKDYDALRESMLELAREKLPAWTDHSPNDLGVVLLELFAYMGDMLFYYQDRIANESYLDSAVERRSVMNLLRLIGYELRPPRPASADLSLWFSAPGEVVIPHGAEFTTKAEDTGESIRFRYIRTEQSFDVKEDLTPDGELWLLKKLPVVQVDAVVEGEVIGSSDGAANQRFSLSQSPLIDNTLVVHVDTDGYAETWQQKETLLFSRSDDNHFVVRRDEKDIAWIEFGDGKYGRIPSRGRDNITVSYLAGGGEKGNVPANTITESEADINLFERCANPQAASGGAEHEALAVAAERGPRLFRAMGRTVTAEDYVAHALEFGVGKARARPASWNRIELYVAPVGGGTPSDTLKEDLRHYLEDKRVVTTQVDIADPVYVSVRLGGSLIIEPYAYADEIKQRVGNAIRELFHFDNVDFEYRLYISKIYEAVEAIQGVTAVHVNKLQRHDAPADTRPVPEDGTLLFEWDEIPVTEPVSWSWPSGGNKWQWSN